MSKLIKHEPKHCQVGTKIVKGTAFEKEPDFENMSEKEKALYKFKLRKANPPKKIDNADLYAGAPMFYYCKLCEGAIILPESHWCAVPKLCDECDFIREMGWFD